MDAKKLTPEQILSELIQRYPQLRSCETKVSEAYDALCACYASGGKVLVAGNGGSASDSEHITGELMKSFRFRHDIPEDRQKEAGGARTDAPKAETKPSVRDRLKEAGSAKTDAPKASAVKKKEDHSL